MSFIVLFRDFNASLYTLNESSDCFAKEYIVEFERREQAIAAIEELGIDQSLYYEIIEIEN